MKELHLRKKHFKLEWYSGEGAGGQHRNKHENCCRITHIETGLQAKGTASKSRVANQRHAFNHLVARIIAHYATPASRREDGEKVRTYHAERNEVLDHASGITMRYSDVIGKGKVGPLIEARKEANE
jgi:peptide chain release factor 1